VNKEYTMGTRLTTPRSQWKKAREANRDRLVVSINNPSKWGFLDLETGDVWRWDAGTFRLCHEGDGHVTLKPSERRDDLNHVPQSARNLAARDFTRVNDPRKTDERTKQ
jgi:hypothetical protein